MVGEMVQNSQSLYSFTFNAIVIVHETKDPRHKCYTGNIFFSAALDLLEECEREWNTAEVGVRENIQIRLEYLIVALQQVLPFVSINSAVLNEILGNIRLLHGQWIQHDSSNCTNLALYSITSPEVFRSGSVGRPRYLISEEVLLYLRSSGFTWTKIAQMLLVSQWTLRRRIVEYGLEEITGHDFRCATRQSRRTFYE